MRPVFECANTIWYYKQTGQWKDEILPVNVRMEEIYDGFAIRAIRTVSPGSPAWKLAKHSKLPEGIVEKLFLLKLSKWMVLTMTNIGASVHYGSSQSIIAIKNLTKLFKSEKTLCMLLRAVNSNQTIKHKVNSANITSPPKRGCMEESTPVH